MGSVLFGRRKILYLLALRGYTSLGQVIGLDAILKACYIELQLKVRVLNSKNSLNGANYHNFVIIYQSESLRKCNFLTDFLKISVISGR